MFKGPWIWGSYNPCLLHMLLPLKFFPLKQRRLLSPSVFVLGLTFLQLQFAPFPHTLGRQCTTEVDRAATVCQGQRPFHSGHSKGQRYQISCDLQASLIWTVWFDPKWERWETQVLISLFVGHCLYFCFPTWHQDISYSMSQILSLSELVD